MNERLQFKKLPMKFLRFFAIPGGNWQVVIGDVEKSAVPFAMHGYRYFLSIPDQDSLAIEITLKA